MFDKTRLVSMFLAALLFASQGWLPIAFAVTSACDHAQEHQAVPEADDCCMGSGHLPGNETETLATTGSSLGQSSEQSESQDCCECKCCHSVARAPAVNLPTHTIDFVEQIESIDRPSNVTHPLGWLPSPDQPPQLV